MADTIRTAQPALGASEAAIQAHYDISNDFYALWLDPSMVYSCALWHVDDDATSLQRAQQLSLIHI